MAAPKLNEVLTVEWHENVESNGVVKRRKRTREITRGDRVLELIGQGADQSDAAMVAGIGERTFYDWCNKGKAAKSGQYRRFYDSLLLAKASKRVQQDLRVTALAQQDPAMFRWQLERTRPEKYGKRDPDVVVNVSGPGPQTVLQVKGMPREDLAALAGVDLDDMDGLRLPTEDRRPTTTEEPD